MITKDYFELGASKVGEFEEAVSQSRYAVVVLTSACLDDAFARFSERLATFLGVNEDRNRVIPLLLEPCKLPPSLDSLVGLDFTREADREEQLDRLRRQLGRPAPTPVELACPYQGLTAFGRGQADFYGRAPEVDRITLHFQKEDFLLLTGPSGCGKTSLLQAGLIPALAAASSGWNIVLARPGAEPLQALATAFGLSVPDLLRLPQAGGPSPPPSVPPPVAAGGMSSPSPRVLLVLDPFEDLFIEVSQTAEQTRFIAALKALQCAQRCGVLLSLRSDFVQQLRGTALWPQAPNQILRLAPLRGPALRDAIALPAKAKGVMLDQVLVESLWRDAGDEPGPLPFVQDAMLLLWQKREYRWLSASAYEGFGGDGVSALAVALMRIANAALNALPPDRQTLAMRIMLRMVQFGQGRKNARRQVLLNELSAEGDEPRTLYETLLHMTTQHLLTFDGDIKGAFLNLAHESLITIWQPLKDWIEEYGQPEQLRRRLLERAQPGAAPVRRGACSTRSTWRVPSDGAMSTGPNWEWTATCLRSSRRAP